MADPDCERRDGGWLEQDVNAWTSAGYVAVGVVLAIEVARRRLPRSVYALAGLAIAEGAGSIAFHGAPNDASQLLHDGPLVAMVGYLAGWHAGRLFDSTARGALTGAALGLVWGVVAWAFWADGINAGVAVAAVVTIGASLVAWRQKLPAVWHWPVLLFGVVALATWGLGHESSPLCDPDSGLQWHGVWHVLTAVFLLVWVDAAYGADDPAAAPRLFRRGTDRTLGLLTIVLVRTFHRSVDVAWRERMPRDRPVLVVANHGNGFVDPIVVASVLGRLPRFIAKAALWKVVFARPFLALAGVLPVYRSSDGDRSSNNRSVFAACHREFDVGATVAIFPEGTTGDRAGLDRVKSGAARIALGGVPTAPDLVIVPIGLAFENRVETRSRAVVIFGDPIEVAAQPGAPTDEVVEPDRDAVNQLTATITDALEAVSPSFATVEEREILRAAAAVELDEVAGPSGPKFGEVEVLARELATRPEPVRARIVEAYRRYATRLQLIGIGEAEVHRTRPSMARIVLSLIGAFFGGTVLALATLWFVPAIALTVVITGTVKSTATKGTVRLLVGLVTGLATVVVAGVVLADGWGAVLAGVFVGVGGVVALVIWPPLIRVALTFVGWLRTRDRAGPLAAVFSERAEVIETVRAALSTEPVADTTGSTT
ncbi:MAG: 1-acyl-sn-glycerol-3-phosphate acyltransferase [Actinomycetota bacterium]